MAELIDFEAFWSAYPRKVAKKAAEKAWARVAVSSEAIEQIMAGLKAQLPAMLAKERKFVAHPATWLNQQRFDDEIESPKIRPRVIACEFCADTGVVQEMIALMDATYRLIPCECAAGQLPGVLAGVSE